MVVAVSHGSLAGDLTWSRPATRHSAQATADQPVSAGQHRKVEPLVPPPVPPHTPVTPHTTTALQSTQYTTLCDHQHHHNHHHHHQQPPQDSAWAGASVTGQVVPGSVKTTKRLGRCLLYFSCSQAVQGGSSTRSGRKKYLHFTRAENT